MSSNSEIAQKASEWALSKIGCKYSQAQRTQEKIFDCSSLVARAYSAQGKKWRYGGSVPISMYEVYDDDFELVWPENYADIGKKLGGADVIKLATQAGDLQFLCTDSKTTRKNKITHVTMVVNSSRIVHARSSKYGVCTNSISLYSGKVCALVRYNPECSLRKGMCGWRTLALQEALNANGAAISTDGEFGNATQSAVKAYQKMQGLQPSGIADKETLGMLMGDKKETEASVIGEILRVTGKSVNIRSGPGKQFEILGTAHKGDLLNPANTENWLPFEMNNTVCWISKNYIEKVKTNENEGGI